MTTFRVGDRVTPLQGMDVDIPNSYRRFHLEPGQVATVTRVGTVKVAVRSGGHSVWVYMDELELSTTRELGTVPEGGISPDDPGLAWLWEDAAQAAEYAGFCAAYDNLCDLLGVPGRMRKFKVEREIEGITATFSLEAHSRTEAEKLVDAKLVTRG
jgi:hypothetical protein